MTTKPIAPQSPAEAKRMQDVSMRLRMMESDTWREDARNHMAKYTSARKARAYGDPSIALNLYRSMVNQVAVLCNQDPTYTSPYITDDARQVLDAYTPWLLHRRLNRLVVGLRDCLLQIHWGTPAGSTQGTVSVEIVSPHEVEIETDPNAPMTPVVIRKAVWLAKPVSPTSLAKPTETHGWYWHQWSLRDNSFRILEGGGKRKDVTKAFGLDPHESFAWYDPDLLDAEGRPTPYLPWVMYRAEPEGTPWSVEGWGPLVWGTLDLSVLMTFWQHSVRNASWSQAYGLDVALRGLRPTEDGAKEIETDPKSLLMFDSRGDKASLSSLPQTIDPKNLIDAIITMQTALLSSLGVTQVDVQAAQSGVALQIRQDKIRQMVAAYAPSFRAADSEYLRKISLVHNLNAPVGSPVLPTQGYVVQYPALPRTREEQEAEVNALNARLDRGLISIVDLKMAENPGMTREQAIADLERVAVETRRFGIGNPAR